MSVIPARPAGVARRAHHSTALRALARGGYLASGVLHVLIAWLAVQLALGRHAGEPNEAGAFQTIAEAPGGTPLLWAIAAGLAALALWQLAAAVVGVPGADAQRQTGERVKSAAKGVLYGALAAMAFRYAQGDEAGNGHEESLAARALSMPAGQWLMGLVGLVIVGVGIFHIVKGWRKKFLRDLAGVGGRAVGRAVVRLGQVGYIAMGIALGVVGGLVVAAAVTADPKRVGGFDEALLTIRDQPFGQVLFIVVALGVGAHGVYSFARARYARL